MKFLKDNNKRIANENIFKMLPIIGHIYLSIIYIISIKGKRYIIIDAYE